MTDDDSAHFRRDERFRKAERLLEREEFLRTRRQGERASSSHLIAYARPNGRLHARLGITASTKVGPATVRNGWKRRIRESFRSNKREFPGGHDFVVIVKASVELPSMEQLESECVDLLADVASRIDDETKA